MILAIVVSRPDAAKYDGLPTPPGARGEGRDVINPKGSLSRELAMSLVNASPALSRPVETVRLSGRGLEAGLRHGVWRAVRGNVWGPSYEPTDAGRRFATAVKSDVFANALGFVPRQTVRRTIVEVTGIVDAIVGGGVKEVQFAWEYEGLPSPAIWYASAGGRGVALMRKYDDGWRVEEVELDHTDAPASLSASEESEFRNAERRYSEWVRQGEERRRIQEAAEQDRLMARFRASRTRRVEIARYKVRQLAEMGSGTRAVPTDLVVTDVDIHYEHHGGTKYLRPSYFQGKHGVISYWMGGVRTFTSSLPWGIQVRGCGPGTARFVFENRAEKEEARRLIKQAQREWFQEYGADSKGWDSSWCSDSN